MAVAAERFRWSEVGDEVWLDSDEMLWFDPERKESPAESRVAGDKSEDSGLGDLLGATLTGATALAGAGGAVIRFPGTTLPARARPHPRRRRWSAQRKRRFATRFIPTLALTIAVAVSIPMLVHGHLEARAQGDEPVRATVAASPRIDLLVPARDVQSDVTADAGPPVSSVSLLERVSTAPKTAGQSLAPTKPSSSAPADVYPEVRWRESTAIGLPQSGSLVDGVQLPIEGPDWVTWDPVRDRAPNRASRLYGTDDLVRVIMNVLAEYREAHPDAPRVVVGDLSRRKGGPINQHVSHQNGLDVDVYYPRLDHRRQPPVLADQIDRRLAQHLVDRFVAAGAELVLVSQARPLRGPSGVVYPYPGHEDHMHIRLPRPSSPGS